MPANLTPIYLEAERRFKSAKTTEEKIAALEEMMATIPRHKGTEKMQAELKRRLSKLRAEAARRPASRAGDTHRVEKEGVGQVALVGPPNAGKSLLVRKLTHAQPEVADYPFTTRVPLPGMMPFEDVQVQLVDLPPVHPDFPESWHRLRCLRRWARLHATGSARHAAAPWRRACAARAAVKSISSAGLALLARDR